MSGIRISKTRIVIIGLALALVACNKSVNRSETRPLASEEQTFAVSGFSLALAVGLQGHVSAVLGMSPVYTDTVLVSILTCPVVTIESSFPSGRVFRLQYGDGCKNSFNSTPSSGVEMVTATLDSSGLLDLLADFQDLTQQGSGISGEISVRETSHSTIRIEFLEVVLETGGETTKLSGFLDATRGVAPSRGKQPLCWWWEVGQASVSIETAAATYSLSILEPLVVPTCCPFPVGGTALLEAEGEPPAEIDFGDNACDGEATITVAGQAVPVWLKTSP